MKLPMHSVVAPTVTRKTKVQRTSHDGQGDGCATVLYNCNCHTFESVIVQLVYSLGCSESVARRYAYVVHTSGKATVFTGARNACEDVADKLAQIGLVVRVTG